MLRNVLGNVPNVIRIVTNIVWDRIQVIISLVGNSARSVKNSVSWPFKELSHLHPAIRFFFGKKIVDV